MTWTAFFQAMRSGVTQRMGSASARQASQQTRTQSTTATSRSAASTQANKTAATRKPLKHRPDVTEWDFMVLDVS